MNFELLSSIVSIGVPLSIAIGAAAVGQYRINRIELDRQADRAQHEAEVNDLKARITEMERSRSAEFREFRQAIDSMKTVIGDMKEFLGNRLTAIETRLKVTQEKGNEL